MLEMIKDLLNLVSKLDPEIKIEDVKVTIASDLSNHNHQHHTLVNDEEFEELLGNLTNSIIVFEQPLDELGQLEICTSNHSWKLAKESIPYAITNQKLGSALAQLLSLSAITPAENSVEKIIANLQEISDLTDLSMEYIEFEDTTLREISDCTRPMNTDQYSDILHNESQRIINDLNFIRAATVGSERAMELLASFAKERYQIARDETPILVALGSKVLKNSQQAENEEIASALWIGLFGTDNLHDRSIEIMPAWVAELFAAIHIDFLRSTPRQLGTIDEIVLETAKKLWLESDDSVGAYANFNDAIVAAEKLTL